MAKKHGKNLQKLLKRKQLEQLQQGKSQPMIPLTRSEGAGTEAEPMIAPAVIASQPILSNQPDLPKLPAGENRPIIKTLISTAIIAVILAGVSLSATSQNYLNTFGDWLYVSLDLNN